MRVLGIDPGTWVVGFGVVEQVGSQFRHVDSGVLRLGSRGTPLETRLTALHEGLLSVLTNHGPDAVALEEAFYGRSAQSALRIGESRGVVMLTTRLRQVDLFQYAPASIKKALTGNGNAAKSQVGFMVSRLLGLAEPPSPADVSDALAIAICHCHRFEVLGS